MNAISTARAVRRVVLVASILAAVAAAGLLSTRDSADASIQRMYTLPFYSRAWITCSVGPYINCGPNLPPGNNLGTDYSLGQQPGVDFPLVGEVVVAAATGTAKKCPFDPVGAGNYVVIDHGSGHRTRYLHLNGFVVTSASGQPIGRGEVLGYEGTSGESSTGPHLDFGTRHGATAFGCGTAANEGTFVDPYAPSTYLWQDDPANYSDSSPSIATWSSSRVDIFVRGKNDDLYKRTLIGGTWSGWSQPRPGSCLRSAPSASTWASNRIDVFYRGCDDDLWRTTWNGSSWSASNRPMPGKCLLAAPAATSWGVNRIDVFYRGCDNQLYQMTWNGTSWSQVPPFAGTCMLSGPGAVAPGVNRFDLAYRGCDNYIYHPSYSGGSWQQDNFFGCTMVAPSVTSWASNRVDVFHRGCGPLEGVFQNSYNGGWSGWIDRGGCLASGPGGDAWAPDQLAIPYRGCDLLAGLYEAFWNGGAWSHYDYGVDMP